MRASGTYSSATTAAIRSAISSGAAMSSEAAGTAAAASAERRASACWCCRLAAAEEAAAEAVVVRRTLAPPPPIKVLLAKAPLGKGEAMVPSAVPASSVRNRCAYNAAAARVSTDMASLCCAMPVSPRKFGSAGRHRRAERAEAETVEDEDGPAAAGMHPPLVPAPAPPLSREAEAEAAAAAAAVADGKERHVAALGTSRAEATTVRRRSLYCDA